MEKKFCVWCKKEITGNWNIVLVGKSPKHIHPDCEREWMQPVHPTPRATDLPNVEPFDTMEAWKRDFHPGELVEDSPVACLASREKYASWKFCPYCGAAISAHD